MQKNVFFLCQYSVLKLESGLHSQTYRGTPPILHINSWFTGLTGSTTAYVKKGVFGLAKLDKNASSDVIRGNVG